jgi:FtsP/CotA-like multicopper oxidase with cupredoxin domain
MNWTSARGSCLLIVLVACAGPIRLAAQSLPAIAVNDNLSPAGELRSGVLTIHLEIGQGNWHPESDMAEGIPVNAFGETGKPLQIPGPLMRVPQGTQIHAIMHNALPVAAIIHGLHERPGDDRKPITVQPGTTQEVQFHVWLPGTYYYWAATNTSLIGPRKPEDSQLSGALIVDPPGVPANDRVFVIGHWGPVGKEVNTINGKSWPHTERLSFSQGDTVHWRWLNLSASAHAMHMHGFYYHVGALGDGKQMQSFSETMPPLIVTQFVPVGGTFDMSFLAEHPGKWLFHCHMLEHMLPQEANTAADDSHHAEVESAGMAGLVMGFTVSAGKEEAAPAWRVERKLQLIIEERPESRPAYSLEVRDLAKPQAPLPSSASPLLIGPPIVLTQRQATEIEVVNHMKQPTAIHWHGMELESYYDGVAGWSGDGQKTQPPIMPGESFVSRLAPLRAGSFIYHTHWHDEAQLTNGIYGPLIVMPLGQEFDPATDLNFLFSMGTFEPFGEMLLLNGSPQPAPLQLKVGVKYRFRLTNIAPSNVGMRASLRQSGNPVQWRIVAKDGAELPPAAATMKTAELLLITVGETYDFEYQASTPQELSLEVYLPGPKLRATQGLVFAAASAP